jgi:hypothetical protein
MLTLVSGWARNDVLKALPAQRSEVGRGICTLLTPFSDHPLAERLDELGMLAIGAALTLCHQGKNQVPVSKVAAEVNRIHKGRG